MVREVEYVKYEEQGRIQEIQIRGVGEKFERSIIRLLGRSGGMLYVFEDSDIVPGALLGGTQH